MKNTWTGYIWAAIFAALTAANVLHVTDSGSSAVWSGIFVTVSAILGTAGGGVSLLTRAVTIGAAMLGFNTSRLGLDPPAASIVFLAAAVLLLVEAAARRLPSGGHRQMWLIYLVALLLIALAVWYGPMLVMPLLGVPLMD